jgi:hypothetical protein
VPGAFSGAFAAGWAGFDRKRACENLLNISQKSLFPSYINRLNRDEDIRIMKTESQRRWNVKRRKITIPVR